MNKPSNMAELFERLNDLKSVFRYGQKLIPIIQSLLDFMSETVPLLENINASIAESTTKIPRASSQINNVTDATELATTEILDIVDIISNDIVEIENNLQNIIEIKEQKNEVFQQIKKLAEREEIIKLLDKYEELDNNNYHDTISQAVKKIKNDAYNITLSLQVQDITSQQLAAVNHLIVSVQERLSSLILNLEESEMSEFETLSRENTHFDPNASYSKDDGRQNMVDSVISSQNQKASQDEIDKLFS